MKIISYLNRSEFTKELDKTVNRINDLISDDLSSKVRQIVNDIKKNRDKALFHYTKKFDNVLYDKKTIKVKPSEIEKAFRNVPDERIKQLQLIRDRIERFHKEQIVKGYKIKEGRSSFAINVRALSTVAIYVPGGKASYPSSVMMNAIPAKVAGVKRIIMLTPTPNGVLNDLVITAARIAGIDEIYKIGGAQAIASAAFSTESIPRVDKIVGPGNIYVAEAKRLLYGIIDIDMIAGPSEIVIIADQYANPKFIAYDLLAQAEHDEIAHPILISSSEKLAHSVLLHIKDAVEKLGRKKIAKASIKRNGKAFIVRNLNDAIDLANLIAPEHLELSVKNPEKYLDKIENGSAVFLGEYTPEALGDYIAGPNHVLPTSGAARFGSPLGVYDFIKRQSVISVDRSLLKKLASATIDIAMAESLSAHALAVKVRLEKQR